MQPNPADTAHCGRPINLREPHARQTSSNAPRISLRPINELKPDPHNPRHHTRKQIRQLALSIKTFGFTVPALVDRDGNVIAGHGRIRACRELGWSEIPTIVIDGLSESERRALMLADNRLAENARWDKRLLAEQLRDLSLAELDFSIEVTGFEIGEIDLQIDMLNDGPKAEDPAGSAIEPSTTPPISRTGDLWILGEHRVLCGSVLDMAALRTLMSEERAAMVFTDPPFNVSIDGHATEFGTIHPGSFATAAGERSRHSFGAALATVLRNYAALCKDGALLYVCVDWRQMSKVLAAGRDIGAELLNLCIWVKDNPSRGSLYPNQHELVFVFRTGRGAHRNNVRRGRIGRNRSNVWRYSEVNSFSRQTDDGNLPVLYPTLKPVALVADAIRDCTARGEIVLDGFLGNGTTVIAAERSGRRCYGIELDPTYVDTVIRRWQGLSGNAARHAVSGRTFDDLANEVEAADEV